MKAREHIDAFLACATARSRLGYVAQEQDRPEKRKDGSCGSRSVVRGRAEAIRLLPRRRRQADGAFARDIAMLSAAPDGPVRVAAELAKAGIILVVLEHLPGTFLDGAAMCRGDGATMIALTLRHERIDNCKRGVEATDYAACAVGCGRRLCAGAP